MTQEQKAKLLADTLANGGATVRAEDGEAYTGPGYAVATGPQTFVAMTGGQQIAQWAFNLILDNCLRQNPKFIGTWVDANKIFVEPAAIAQSLVEALLIAKEHNQKAIYAFDEQRTLDVSKLTLEAQ